MLRCCSPARYEAKGVTEIVARDSAVVLISSGTAPEWLQPSRAVSLAIELPALFGHSPRRLACGAVVRGVQVAGGDARVELDITSMEFRAGY
jgi:hypothetical protein